MPEIHGAEIRAQDAEHLRNDRCPECQADLTAQDPAAHAEDHWPSMTLSANPFSDAARRKAAVLKYAQGNTIETTAIDVTDRKAITAKPSTLPAKGAN